MIKLLKVYHLFIGFLYLLYIFLSLISELVNAATSEKLAEVDWMKNIEICEIVSRDKRLAKDVTKAIKKRFGSKNSNSQLYAVMLLEMLMNNIGEDIHKQVIDTGILPILVKIVKKKSDLPVRERIFLLLDATQTSLGGASAKFPQYYNAYYDLVSAGVQFPQRSSGVVSNVPANITATTTANTPGPTPQQNRKNLSNGELLVYERGSVGNQVEPSVIPESSIIIQKAINAAEVMKEVLDAVDPQNPEGGRDEFTLDLVEQCSFQKQRVMHLVMTSRDEKVVSRAIDLNERLEKVLARHDILLSDHSLYLENRFNHEKSGKPTSTANHSNSEEVEEEEAAEQLFRRLRKGKACAIEEEDASSKRIPVGLVGLSIGERANRPIIRPISDGATPESDVRSSPPVTLPPPPAKHVEREKFFQHKKADDPAVAGHTRGHSLHSHNTSQSGSGSIEFSE